MLGQNLATPVSGSLSQSREAHAQRRGACPGLSTPMPTGDGLLVRLLPTGTISLDAFAALCDAAQAHGNGVIEITSRGSIQVRGLTPDSAPRFAVAVGAAEIAAADGIPVLSNALAGLDPEEILDAGALARDLRAALARESLGAAVSPKVSVIIDGGGNVSLDDIAADVRFHAEIREARAALRVSVGGDGASSVEIGAVDRGRSVEAALSLLQVIAGRGGDARAREVLAAEGPAAFRAALASAGGFCEAAPSSKQRKQGEAIGAHRLRDGSLACGIVLAFGHADATSLGRLIDAARSAGASGVCAAPGRVVMVIGLTQAAAPAFAASAEQLGFITHPDDPRRYVIACAGAPVCAAAHIAARAVAPAIAAAAVPFLNRSFTIHVSGCAKGCAHPRPAALTVVGTPEGCALVHDGSPRDVPHAVVPAHELPAAIARAAYERTAASRDV
jgi:precorrin-3B synthase